MRHFSAALLLSALFGCVLVGRSIAADAPDGPPPNGGNGGGNGGGGGRQGGGPGGPGGPARGVHLIPPFVQDKLDLTDDQKKQIADLEQEVKAKLSKILTPEQMKTLEEARPPRRGGPGGPGGGQGQGQGPGGGGQGQGPDDTNKPPRPPRPNE